MANKCDDLRIQFDKVMAHAKLTAKSDAERLAAENLLLVPYVLGKFTRKYKRFPTWEMYSAGIAAIYRAAEIHDPAQSKFSTYAHRSIWSCLWHEAFHKYSSDRHEQLASDVFWGAARATPGDAAAKEKATNDCRKVLSLMTPREAEFVRLNYLEGWTGDEIGEAHGMTRARVHRVIKAGMDRVRKALRKQKQ